MFTWWSGSRVEPRFGWAWACDPIGNQYLISGQLEKTADLDEHSTWARNMVTWYWSADTLFWQVSIVHNMDDGCPMSPTSDITDVRKCPIPHSINYEETGTAEGLWDRLGRRKMTNMSFSTFSKPVVLLCEVELTRTKLGALKTSKMTCLSSSV